MATEFYALTLIARIRRGLTFLSYAPLLASASALSFVRVIAYARLLDVPQFGVASQILLVSGLFGIAGHFGTQLLAHRELPLLMATARRRRAVWMLTRVLLTLSASAALALVCAGFGLKLFALSASETAVGILHGWCQQVFVTLSIESKSRLMMREYAAALVIRALAATIAGVVVARAVHTGFATTLAEAIAFAVLTPTMLLRIMREAGVSARVALALAFTSRRGFPWLAGFLLLGSSLVAFASLNVDRWMAAASLDRARFGVYAFATVVLSVAQLAQSVVSAGAFPLLARRRMQFGDGHAMRLAALWSLAALVCGLVVATPAAMLARPLVGRFLPNYSAAVSSMLILLPAGVLRVSDFWSSFLIIAEHESLFLLGQAVALGAALALWLSFCGGGQVGSETEFAWLALGCAGSAYAASAATAVWVSSK